MKRIPLLLSFTLLIGIAIGILATQVLNAQQAPTKRTELLTNDLAGIAGKRATVYRTELAPGASTAKHRHPVDTFVYVLDGTLTLEQEGQGSRTLNAGEVVQEVPGSIYNGRNTGTSPVTILVVSLGEKDQPFSVPVK
jgi:quercetin dioxygenase-like cupin family protein